LGLTGVGPLIAWRKASAANLRRQFIGPVTSGGVTLLALLAAGVRDLYAVMAMALAGFVAGTIAQEFYRGVRARRRMHGEAAPLAFVRLIGRNRRRYGGYIVHAGILIYFVAFAGMAFKVEREATLKPGESVELRSPFGHTYRFTHVGISQYEALNRVVSAATVQVFIDGKPAGLLTSEKRQHVDSFKRPTFEPSTEVGIRSGLREDLYMVFAGAVGGTEEAVYRFNVNPLVWWVWFGGFVLAFGGLVTMWPGGGPTVVPSRPAQGGYSVSLVGAGKE
jgi:cytochrome c-type biogenesis protein CcmF